MCKQFPGVICTQVMPVVEVLLDVHKELREQVGIVEWDSIYCSLQVVEKKAKPHIQVDVGGGQTKTFAPEEISAMVLTKMKETAEAYLGKKVSA